MNIEGNETVTIGGFNEYYGSCYKNTPEYSRICESIEELHKQGFPGGFEINSYIEELIAVNFMLSKASRSIRVICGEEWIIWLALAGPLFNAALRISRNNGDIRFIILANYPSEPIRKLKDHFPECVDYVLGDPQEDTEHCIICDDISLIEQPHKDLNSDLPIDMIKGRVHSITPGDAQTGKLLFDSIFERVKVNK